MQGLPEIGEVLDETYRIESELGRGGFGAVYLARQISMDRDVALKVLVANAMRVDEMIQRFRREVLAVRNLGHPNTIRIYDFRDRADGMLYYAMEYVKGPTLKDVIKEDGPLPPARVHHIIRQVLKSLAEAHSYGIIHRDLKPANIMLAEMYGEKDFVKVLDFGIAKILDGEDEEKEAITSAGVLVGTLNYMSPEQIAGGEISAASDLYALALIAVEMLTGKSVFAGTGRWEILHKQISDEPVEVPEVVLQSPLGPIIRQALNKRTHERFSSAEKMLVEMDKVKGLGSGPLLDLDEVEIEAAVPAASKPVSQSGPISNSTPVSHSGPITNSSAVRESRPPGEAVALSPGQGRTEGSAQIRVGAPGFSDDQTGQVQTTPDFLPQRDPAHTPVPSPSPPVADVGPDESEKPTIAPGPGALPAVTGPAAQPADPKPVQQTRVNTHQTGRQTFEAAPGTAIAPTMEQSGGNKGLVIGIVVLVVVALAAGAAVMVLGGGEKKVEPPTEPAVVTPAVEQPTQPEGFGDLVVERPSEPAPGGLGTIKDVKISTGDVKASVYLDDKLLGTTPLTLSVGEDKVYTVQAEGFEKQVLTLNNKSQDEVAVELKKVPGSDKPVVDKPADPPPRDTKPKDTKPADTKPKDTKPADTKPKDTKPGLDWVPIGAGKKDDKKKDEKKVPVF